MLRTASAFNMTSVIFRYLLPWPLANSLDYTLCWSTHRHAAGGSARLEHTQALRSWLSQSRAHAGTWLMAPLASSTRKHFARGSHNPEPTQALGSWLRSTRAHASPWHAARGSDGLEHMQARRHAGTRSAAWAAASPIGPGSSIAWPLTRAQACTSVGLH
jgi:hypothetical protein